MVSLYPKLDLEDDEEIYTEMIFIVDRSGSMSGSRIDKVKDTMQIFLRSLGEGTMFNIVGFGTRTEMLFKDGSKEYNDTNLDLATKHVTNLKANLGGTNILQPLELVLKSKTIDGYPRQLFILTDGEVSNTSECIEFVRKHADTTRVFTFGIGNEASQELVKGMAKAGEGFYEFITGNDNMETKVMRQLSRAMQPALSNLTIDWGGLEAHQTPYRLPPLFAGGRLVIYSLLPEGSKASDVTINAQTAIKPFSATVKLNLEEPEDGQLLHKLATRSLIRDFEEGRSYLHRPNGGFISGKSQQDVKEETIRLSTTYGVLSKFTAFVAEEEREEATEGSMQVRRCNVIQQQQQQQRQQQLVRPAQRFGMARGGGGGGRGGMLKCAAMPQPVCQSLSSTGAAKSKSKRKVEKKKKESASPRKGGASLNFFARSKSSSSSVTAMPPPPPAAAYGGAPPAAPPPAPVSAFDGDCCAFESSSPLSQLQSAPPLLSPVASSSFKKMDRECDERQRRSSSPKRMSRRNEEAEALVCLDDESEAASEEEEEAEKVAGPPPAEMKQIIMKQKASGCWALKDVASLLGRIKADHIKKGVPSELENKADDAVLDLWATAIVVEYLTSKFADQKTNWDLVVKKAKKWILRQHKQLNIKPESLDWLAKASAFVQSHA
ncbi:von Willebrand factor A domain-containing protein 5A [Balamuthia mandrillaris]